MIHTPTNHKKLSYFTVREAEMKAIRDIYIEDERTRGDEDGTFGPTYTEHGNPVTYFVRDHHDGTYGIVSDVTGHVITNDAGSFELAIQGALTKKSPRFSGSV